MKKCEDIFQSTTQLPLIAAVTSVSWKMAEPRVVAK